MRIAKVLQSAVDIFLGAVQKRQIELMRTSSHRRREAQQRLRGLLGERL